jgi:DNA repair protein RadD
MSFELRYYQREACDAAWQHLKLGKEAGNPLIESPTGTGKSLIIAELCRAAVQEFNGRVMVLAHRKELLEQNASKVKSLLPLGITCGLYSAGLRRFAMDDAVIVAGIQSVYKKAGDFGRRHLVVVDEAHLVPKDGEGMYRKFLGDLEAINPKLRIIGLTATPFRTDSGPLCSPDGLFQKICYKANLAKMIADGFLTPLTNQVGKTNYDTSTLKIRGGEFVQADMGRLFDDDNKTQASCLEIVQSCHDRKSIIVFTSSVSHAEHVANTLGQLTSQEVGVVTGESKPLERETVLRRFKEGNLRWLVNVDVLTTGFDATRIDAIAILRATMSPGLFVQICGRGMRLHPGKENCLVLDYGENFKRHGALDAIDFGKPKKVRGKQGAGSGSGNKQCPNCNEWVAPSTRQCECGFIFLNHQGEADTSSDIMATPKKWEVVNVDMQRHIKKSSLEGTPDTLRVTYTVQPIDRSEQGTLTEETISEWVCIEHDGFARRKAEMWWVARSLVPCPDTIEEALDWWKRGAIGSPEVITTIRKGRFNEILSTQGIYKPEEWSDPLPEMTEEEVWGEEEEAPF